MNLEVSSKAYVDLNRKPKKKKKNIPKKDFSAWGIIHVLDKLWRM